jgi:hypothetical protein
MSGLAVRRTGVDDPDRVSSKWQLPDSQMGQEQNNADGGDKGRLGPEG